MWSTAWLALSLFAARPVPEPMWPEIQTSRPDGGAACQRKESQTNRPKTANIRLLYTCSVDCIEYMIYFHTS